MRKLLFVSVLALVTALPSAAQDPAMQDPFLSSGKVISFNRLKEDGLTYGGILSLENGKVLFEGANWDASLVHDGFSTIDTWNFEQPGSRFFFVDETGKKAFGGRTFEAAGTFSEGKVFVVRGGRISCMDTAGKTLFTLPADALFALPYREGYAWYKAESGWWLVDASGQPVFPESFADVQPFVVGGRVVAADAKTGLWGVLSVSGKVILPFKYGYLGVPEYADLLDWIRAVEGSLMPFRPEKEDYKWGLVEVPGGKEIAKPVYYHVLPESGGFSMDSDEDVYWLDAKTRKFAAEPEKRQDPPALAAKYTWIYPITGTDLYMARQQSDMKAVIVSSAGKVVVAPSGNAYPFWADKETMSSDYLGGTMGCARDEYAEVEMQRRFVAADGDYAYEMPDLTCFDPDSLDDSDWFWDYCMSITEEGAEFQDFTWDIKNIFLDPKPLTGILGNDLKEISVWFTAAEPTSGGFAVKGKSSVAGGAACNFTGELGCSILSPMTMANGHIMYALCGTYYLEEDAGQKGSGVFEGHYLYYLEQLKDGRLTPVKDRNLPQELGYDMNKVFVGTWTSHRTGKAKRCNWSDGFVPFSQPL